MESIPFTLQLSSFINYEQLQTTITLTDDNKNDNSFSVTSEIESLQTILNEQELQVLDKYKTFPEVSGHILEQIDSVLKLSLIPNCNKKFTIVDVPKDISIELRSLPTIDLFIVIPTSYPSNQMPLLYMSTPFFKPCADLLYSSLNDKWTPDSVVIYEFVCFL
jgi:hypothetical protein